MSHLGWGKFGYFGVQKQLQDIDITIVGSSLTAALLAGQLSQKHKLNVALVMDTSVPFRTTSNNGFCFPMLLAPHLWHCTQNGREDALALCRQIGGRRAVASQGLSVASISSYGAESLDHLSQLTRLFGIESERRPSKRLANAISAYAFRGISEINGAHIWRGLGQKFEEWQIPILNMRSVELAFEENAYQIQLNEKPQFLSKELVLVDDGVSHFASPDTLAKEFQFKAKTEIAYKDRLTAQSPLFAPEMGMSLSRSNSKVWNVTIAGSRRDAIDGLSTYLRGFKPERVFAMRRKNQLAHLSNFPYFGELRDKQDGTPKAIVGFDNFGPFGTPMLARWIMGALTSDDEGLVAEALDKQTAGGIADLNYPNIFEEEPVT